MNYIGHSYYLAGACIFLWCVRAAGPTGPSHHVVRARSFDSGDGGAGKFCEPVRRTLNSRKHHIKVPRAGVGCVSTRLTVKARIWPAGQYGSDRRFLPEAIQAAGGVGNAPPSYLSKQSHLVGPLLVEKRGTGSLSTGSQSRWPVLRVPRAIGNTGRRNVQSGHGELIGVIPTPFASHAPLGRVALKRCRPGTFGDPRLLRRSIRLSHKQ